MEELDLLILGAGWTSTFLIPLLKSASLPFAATTTTGRSVSGVPTLPFKFDPANPDPSAIAALPRARYILVTFPLYDLGPSKYLIETYSATHVRGDGNAKGDFRFIQLGSTGIWQGQAGQTSTGEGKGPWLDRRSEYDGENKRAKAEEEVLGLGGCVMNLAGLWGGERSPRNWVSRVAKTRDDVKGKKSLHLVHGVDVARGILGVVKEREKWEEFGRGQRWMVTDGWVYDWWSLLVRWGEKEDGGLTEQAGWVWELMSEDGVKALPRESEVLGRCYDSREFWRVWGVVPLKGGI
ncbi:hypothetical protein OQA88_3072 [Cercophora sp. LCS_1]